MKSITKNGLDTKGLPAELENFCCKTHAEFLRSHEISSWPLKIELTPLEPVARTHKYDLSIRCGASHYETATANPGERLQQDLQRLLEEAWKAENQNR